MQRMFTLVQTTFYDGPRSVVMISHVGPEQRGLNCTVISIETVRDYELYFMADCAQAPVPQ